jgi:hypothetical protein
MKSLYVTSVEHYIGKTAMCLALGKRMQADNYKVGYLKPVSTQPWRTPEGKVTDQDAALVKKLLGLEADASELAGMIITASSLRERLRDGKDDLLDKIKKAAEAAARGKDILLLEGGANMREGYSVGLSNLRVAEAMQAPVLVLVKFRREMQVVDDALTAMTRLGKQLMGVILNQVPEDAKQFVAEYAVPFLEKQGIRVFGVLPSVPILSALSVGELIQLLKGEILTKTYDPDSLCERFVVGAMTLDAATSRFQKQKHKAVITGGERADIILAALETSTRALILTDGIRPSPLIIRQAEELNVPIMLVKANPIEAMEILEAAYGRTPLGAPEKLEAFMQLTAALVDMKGIYAGMGLG